MHAEADLPRRHRISVADYYRMADVGILDDESRVELIDGDIIDMPPPGSPHAATVTYLTEVLGRAAGDRPCVSATSPSRSPTSRYCGGATTSIASGIRGRTTCCCS